MKKPEIMSPAGYWPQLHAAIEAGADSVYFGLKHFSARAKVGFAVGELPEVMRTLHERGVRGYVTFNTLVFEHELVEAARAIAAIAEAGADALIIQDLGILPLARRIAPGIELHASTQMSITDAEGVRFARSFGADRVTLARELSLPEIRRIYDETGCSLEIFVHGALCVAYSGQCFSSEAWGGRSANRGQCAQACRMPYGLIVDGEERPTGDARYLLSPGDLYTLHEIPAIVGSGVSALKIEGRYKGADYVALTTNAYRQAVDEAWAGLESTLTRAEELRLEQAYSRGLAPSFLSGTNHQAVVKGRSPRHRGVLIGRVTRVLDAGVVIETIGDAHGISALREGDGLVFDAADWRSPSEPEEGGRVYEVISGSRKTLELRFGNRAVRLDRIRPSDLVWRTDQPELAQAVRQFIDPGVPKRRQPLNVHVVAREGARLASEWSLVNRPEISVSAESPGSLGAARSRAVSVESLQGQFGRLGNTAYELASVSLDVEGSPFASPSILNQMRREAVEQLKVLQSAAHVQAVNNPVEALEASHPPHCPAADPGGFELHLLVRTPAQLDAAIRLAPASITLDYLDLFGLRPSIERIKSARLVARVASPRILKPGEARILDFLVSLDCAILVRATGMLNALQAKNHGPLVGDFSLNAANSLSAAEYLKLGISRLTPTHDLNARQIASLAEDAGAGNIEVVAWQHLPVFHTEHCVFCRFLSTGTSYKDCGRPCEKHRVELRDQNGRSHPVMADVGCRNTVFGAEAQEASAHLDLWRSAGIRHYRLEFAHETPGEVTTVASLFREALAGTMTAAQLNKQLRAAAPQGTTQGSLYIPSDYLTLPVLQ